MQFLYRTFPYNKTYIFTAAFIASKREVSALESPVVNLFQLS